MNMLHFSSPDLQVLWIGLILPRNSSIHVSLVLRFLRIRNGMAKNGLPGSRLVFPEENRDSFHFMIFQWFCWWAKPCPNWSPSRLKFSRCRLHEEYHYHNHLLKPLCFSWNMGVPQILSILFSKEKKNKSSKWFGPSCIPHRQSLVAPSLDDGWHRPPDFRTMDQPMDALKLRFWLDETMAASGKFTGESEIILYFSLGTWSQNCRTCTIVLMLKLDIFFDTKWKMRKV